MKIKNGILAQFLVKRTTKYHFRSLAGANSEDEKEFLALISTHTTRSPIDTNSGNTAPSSSNVNNDFEISDEGKAPFTVDFGESESELDLKTTTIPRWEFAALAGERLPLFVHGLDADDSDALKKAFAERQPVGDNWLIPYYPNGHQRRI
jgi:hypothetical protein